MDGELRGEESGAGGDGVAGDLVRGDAHPGGDPDGWIEAHGFGEDLGGEGEVGVVRGGWIAGGVGCVRAEDGAGFFVELLLGFGVGGEEIEGEGEGVGGGLVAGEEDGDALVVDLLVGHLICRGLGVSGGVFEVGGGEEHGEEVAAVGGAGWLGAALGDHAVDEGVEVELAALEPAHGGDGQALDGL